MVANIDGCNLFTGRKHLITRHANLYNRLRSFIELGVDSPERWVNVHFLCELFIAISYGYLLKLKVS